MSSTSNCSKIKIHERRITLCTLFVFLLVVSTFAFLAALNTASGTSDVAFADGTAVETWDISATSSDHVTASLYSTGDTYRLEITGSGEMRSFTSSTSTGGGWLYAPWYSSYRSKIIGITIENGVKNIGSYAFRNCSSLTSIEIPSSVTRIDNYAFQSCSGLTSVEIPSGVTSIGSYAFRYCSSLTSITFAEGSQLTSIRTDAFYNCSSLTSIEIPSSVTSISSSAFYYCSSLTSVTFAEGSQLTSIGSYAFKNCSSLTSIEIPSSVTSIGDGAFGGCSSLESITIPFVGSSRKTSSDTYQYPFGYIFGTSSYTGSTACKQYYYGSSTSATTSSTYYIPTSLKNVMITDGEILLGAFDQCTMIQNVRITSYIKTIGKRAFFHCVNLVSVYMPFYVETIQQAAFAECYRLKQIELPSMLVGLENEVFMGCRNLNTINIPSCLNYIGTNAFKDTYSLLEIYNQSSLNLVSGSDSYAGLAKYALHIYNNKSTSSKISYGDDGYVRYNPGDGNTYLTGYIGSDTELVLPSDVTKIWDHAFYHYEKITSVIIPDNVTELKSCVFECCYSLKNVQIADSVTKIGDYSFKDCSALKSIVIPENVTKIGNQCFMRCNSLEEITVPFVGRDKDVTGSAFNGHNDVMVAGIDNSFGYIFGYSDTQVDGTTNQCYTYSTSQNKYLGRWYYIPSSLKKVTVTGGKVFYGAFEHMNNLEEVVFEDGVEYLSRDIFFDNPALKKVTVPFVGSSRNAVYNENQGMHSDALIGYIFHSITLGTAEYHDQPISMNNANSCRFQNLKTIVVTGDRIPDYAFNNCNMLTTIGISDNLEIENLGKSTIDGCSALTAIDVYVDGQVRYSVIKGSLSWTAAKATAENNGGYLATITSVAENEIIRPAIKMSGLNAVWIGASDADNEGEWKWVTDEPWSFDCWRAGEPNDSGSGEDYVAAYGDKDGQQTWNDWEVESSYVTGYIVEYSALFKVDENGFIYYNSEGRKVLMGYVGNAETVVVPDGITEIYKNAFLNNTTMTSVVLPDSLISIGEGAFDGCSSLVEMTLPFVGGYKDAREDKTHLFNYIFGTTEKEGMHSTFSWFRATDGGNDTRYLPDSLKKVTITGGQILYGAFERCPMETVIIQGVTGELSQATFYESTALKTIEIGDGIEAIKRCAFYGCSSLESISLPGTVTTIDSRAFDGCSSLKSIDIPYGVTSIESDIFKNENGNTSCFIETAVVPAQAVVGLPKDTLKNVEITTGGTLDLGIFNGFALESLTISAGVTNVVVADSFYRGALTTIVVKEGNTKYQSVDNCLIDISTKTIVLGCAGSVIPSDGDVVTSIADRAFFGCDGLKAIYIYPNIEIVGPYAFANCDGLKTLSFLGKNFKTELLKEAAFENCTSLTRVLIPSFLTSYSDDELRRDVFNGCLNLDLCVYEKYLERGELCYYYYPSGDANEGNSYTLFVTGRGELSEISLESGFEDVTEVYVDAGITSILDNAFSGLMNDIKVVRLGEDVQYIGHNIFMNTKTVYVLFEGDRPFIEADAFIFELKNVIYQTKVEMFYSPSSFNWTINGNKIIGFDKGTITDGVFNKDSKGFVTKSDDGNYYPVNEAVEVTPIISSYNDTSLGDQSVTIYRDIYNFMYEIVGGQASVIGFKGTYVENLSVPKEIIQGGDNYKVTSVKHEEGYSYSFLREMILNENIKTIGETAFKGSKVEKIQVLTTDTITVEENAFSGCENLEYVYFEGDSFSWEKNSSYFDIKENNEYASTYILVRNELFGTTSEFSSNNDVVWYGAKVYLVSELNGNKEEIKDEETGKVVSTTYYSLDNKYYTAIVGQKNTVDTTYANTSGSSIAEVSIPDYVMKGKTLYKVVGFDRYAFYANRKVERIIFGAFIGEEQTSDVPAIWDCTFRDTVSLKEFVIRGTNKDYSVTDGILFGSNFDYDVHDRKYVEEDDMFVEEVVETITLPSRLVKYPQGKTNASYTVKESVTVIERYAFAGNPYLKEINLNDVTVIGSHAFYNCTNLETISDTDYQIQYLEDSAFENTDITSFKFANALKGIGTRAFWNTNLAGVIKIYDNIAIIGRNAFGSCENISKFVFLSSSKATLNTPVYVSGNEVDEQKNVRFVLGQYGEIYGNTDGKLSLLQFPGKAGGDADFIYDMNNDAISDIKTKVANYTEANVMDVDVSIVSISPYAFADVVHLKEIVIGDDVVTIGSYAFENCENLMKVTIGASYYGTSIKGDDGKYSYDLFRACGALSEIVVDRSNPYYVTDNNGVLYGKRVNEDNEWVEGEVLYYYPAGLTRLNYTVPARTNFIYDMAFAGNTNIRQVVIANVEGIRLGSRAFGDCLSLESAYFFCPEAPYSQSGVKVFDNVANTFKSYYKSTNASGWNVSYFYEYEVEAFEVIKEVPNDTIETQQYIIAVCDSFGKPLPNMVAFVEILDEGSRYGFKLTSNVDGLITFATAHLSDECILHVNVYDPEEIYLPFDADLYPDTEMMITYVYLVKTPDVFGLSFEHKDEDGKVLLGRDIYGQVMEFNIAQFSEKYTYVENGVEKSNRVYDEIFISVQGTWEDGLFFPVYTLSQAGKVIGEPIVSEFGLEGSSDPDIEKGKDEYRSGNTVVFVVSAGEFVPDVPLEVTISLQSGWKTGRVEDRSDTTKYPTTTKTLNMTIIDFLVNEEDVDINTDELTGSSGNFNGGILNTLMGSSSLEMSFGDHISASVEINGTEVTLGLKVKAELEKKSFDSNDCETGYYSNMNKPTGNTYFYQFTDGNYTYNIRFARGTEEYNYYYYRLYVYEGIVPGLRYDETKVKATFGAINITEIESKFKGRAKVARAALMIFTHCSHWIHTGIKEDEIEVDPQNFGYKQKIKFSRVKLDNYSPIRETCQKSGGSNRTSNSFKLTGSLEGKLTFEYNTATKSLQLKSGQIIGMIKLTFKHQSQHIVVGIPVTIEAKIEVSGKITLNLLFGDPKGISIKDLMLEIKAEFELSAGVGCSILSVGLYGKIGFVFVMELYPSKAVRELTLSGEFGAYYKVLWFTGKIKFYSGKWKIIDNPKESDDAKLSDFDASQYKWYSSMFLTSNYEFIGNNTELTEEDYMANGRIVIINGDIYRIYMTYDGSKTKLAISHLGYNGWINGKILDNNDYADGDFELVENNGEIYLLYTQQTRTLTLEEMNDMYASADGLSLKYINLTTTDFNNITGDDFYGLDEDDIVYVVKADVTDEDEESDKYKYLPQIGYVGNRLITVWVQNDDNNVFGVSPYNEQQTTDYEGVQVPTSVYTTKANSIWFAEYISGEWVRKCLISGLSSIVDLAITSDGYVWYVEDKDGDLADNSDSILYALNINTVNWESTGDNIEIINCDPERTGISSIYANDEYLTFNTQDGIYYFASSDLLSTISDEKKNMLNALRERELQIPNGYVVLGESDDPVAVVYKTKKSWEDENELTLSCDTLSIMIKDGEEWGYPVILFDPSTIDGISFGDTLRILNIVSFDARLEGESVYVTMEFSVVINYESEDRVVNLNLPYNPEIVLSKLGETVDVTLKDIDYKENSALFELINDTAFTKNVRVYVDGVQVQNVSIVSGVTKGIEVALGGNIAQIVFKEETDEEPLTIYDEYVDASYVDLVVMSKQLVLGETNEQLIAVKNTGNTEALNYSVYVVAGLPEIDSEGNYKNIVAQATGKNLKPDKFKYYRLALDYSMMIDGKGQLKGDGILTVFVVIDEKTTVRDPYPEDNTDSYYLSAVEQLKLGEAKPVLLTVDGTYYKDSGSQVVLSVVYNNDEYTIVLMDNDGNEVVDTPSILVKEENEDEWDYSKVTELSEEEREKREKGIVKEYLVLEEKYLNALSTGSYSFYFVAYDEKGVIVTKTEYVLTVAELNKGTVTRPEGDLGDDQYEVVWNIDGDMTVEYYDNGVVPEFPADPVKEGYEFVGWSLDGVVYKSGDSLPSESAFYTAVFEEIDTEEEEEYIVITWVFDAENSISSKSVVKSGEWISAPGTPKGMAMVEYWKDEDENEIDRSGGVFYKDTELTAVFHEHQNIVISSKNATCDSEGTITYRCSTCGNISVEIVPATGHKESEWIIDEESTCTAPGTRHKECTVCHTVLETETIDALGHEYAEEFTIDQEPTCTEAGYKSRHCVRCESVADITTIPMTEHNFGDWIVDTNATCKETGSKHRICVDCEFRQDEVIPLAEHTWEVIDRKESSCTESGYKAYQECSVCHAVKDFEVLDMDKHVASDWIIDVVATCIGAGSKHKECKVCKTILETKVIAALGHDYTTQQTVDHAPGCTEAGLKSRHCSRCDAVTDVEVIPATGHEFGTWVVDKEASCSEEGSKHRSCSVCGTREDAVIFTADHTWTAVEGKAASCTEPGYQAYEICSICGTTKGYTVVEKLDHAASDWIVDKEATCTTFGSKHKECTVCHTLLETEVIDTLGHDYAEEYTVDKAASCTEAGYKSKHCTRCDAVTDITLTEATGHEFGEWTLTEEESEWIAIRECVVCGAKESKAVEKFNEKTVAFATAVGTATKISQDGKYEAIKAAIEAYNELSEEEKALMSAEYEQLLETARQYNTTIDSQNENYNLTAQSGLSFLKAWQSVGALITMLFMALKSIL